VESLEEEMMGHPPLDGEQLQAKLCAVETTNRGEEVVMGVQLEVESDEKFEDAELDLEEEREDREETGDESGVFDQRIGDQSEVVNERTGDETGLIDQGTGDESEEHVERDEDGTVEEEETGPRETQVTHSDGEPKKDDEKDSSKEQEGATILNEV
jgi:hypothetical protein